MVLVLVLEKSGDPLACKRYKGKRRLVLGYPSVRDAMDRGIGL